MTKVIILGSDGMVGAEVLGTLKVMGLEVLGTSRRNTDSSKIFFNAVNANLNETFKKYGAELIFINCIGLIRHKIEPNNKDLAWELNSAYPKRLAQYCKDAHHKLINICTDCVYSGKSGNYSENSKPDPVDLYGLSKSDGESRNESVLNIRTSIVGPEKNTALELFSWVLNQAKNQKLLGYVNHNWNGITSLALAKLLGSVILNNQFVSGNIHIIPANKLNKYQLITKIAQFAGRSDLIIEPHSTNISVDRTLSTVDSDRNKTFWHLAGYSKIPKIEELLLEVLS